MTKNSAFVFQVFITVGERIVFVVSLVILLGFKMTNLPK